MNDSSGHTPIDRPRVLIEEWLPAAAIGVECMRERSTGNQPPDKRLHVWFARRPLVAARAAVLGSLLPADFPRDQFERLLGFGRPGHDLVAIRQFMDTGYRVPGGFGTDRAFSRRVLPADLDAAHRAAGELWGGDPAVMDTMAGGGSIPLEAARLGFTTYANELNPVACIVLEATTEFPFRFGEELGAKARRWGAKWEARVTERLEHFFPAPTFAKVHAYIYARTVPCPDTGHPAPLVPDWHLHNPKAGQKIVAEPFVDPVRGTWSVRVRQLGTGAGQLSSPPRPTYAGGKGISLFSPKTQIPAEYIKAKAQAGEMGSVLYAVAVKSPQGLRFDLPTDEDRDAIAAGQVELSRLLPSWEASGVIPTERIPNGIQPGNRLVAGGITHWSGMFSPRQLLTAGVLVEELRALRPAIIAAEGETTGEAVVTLLAAAIDKLTNHNSLLARFESTRGGIKGVFSQHGFAFKPTFAEMAPVCAGSGLEWAVDSVVEAYEQVAKLPKRENAQPPTLSQGSATNLPEIVDGSITAVVVDPPYGDNVQYAELANFFYVWLKRTQGHRRPEWFSSYLIDHEQEAVVNVARHRNEQQKVTTAKAEAHAFYQALMTDAFREAYRILRDDGVLTVMFTHKQQSAWEALFRSLIAAGFTINATWPVKTESEHSLHQAKQNAAQSTVILIARKRPVGTGVGYFDSALRDEIQQKALAAAERLEREGLNAVDQLVGSFGPAIEVFSRYDEVRTDTGEIVGVGAAIDEASDAVSAWRVERLAARGLAGVEPEGRFYLLCWDVLGAAQFRFNEAKLLGHAVGMDVEQLVAAGLVSKDGDKITVLPARDRRRERPLEQAELIQTLFGGVPVSVRRRKVDVLKVHPNDPGFRTALDGAHALVLRYLEAGGGSAGIGNARALALQQGWGKESPVARLIEALVRAAPAAVRHEKGKTSAAVLYPEFRAWHALLFPLFGLETQDWTERGPAQFDLFASNAGSGPLFVGGADDKPEDELEEVEDEANDEA